MPAPELPDPFEIPSELPAKGAARPGGTANWQQAAREDAARQRRNRGLVVSILIFAMLAAAVVAYLMLLKPPIKPVFLVIPLTDYPAEYPRVAWANEDAKQLLNSVSTDADKKIQYGLTSQDSQKLRETLQRLERFEQGTAESPFVLMITGHLGFQAEMPCLIPTDAKRGESQLWVPLAEVFTAIEKCPARNKLLVLDLARPQTNLTTGPWADHHSTRLHQFLSKADKLPCPVLTVCGPGEVSHVIPDEKLSTFGLYLAEALRGWADGYMAEGVPLQPRDRRVTLQEVVEYTRARTSRWAKRNRNRPQMPQLYNPQKLGDFALVLDYADLELPPEEDKEKPTPPPKFEYPQARLLDLWTQRDKLPLSTIRNSTETGALATWEAAAIQAEVRDNSDAALLNPLYARLMAPDAAPAAIDYRSLLILVPENPKAKEVVTKYLRSAIQARGKTAESANPAQAELDTLLSSQPAAVAREAFQWLRGPTAEATTASIREVAQLMRSATIASGEFWTEQVLLDALNQPKNTTLLRTESEPMRKQFLETHGLFMEALPQVIGDFALRQPELDSAVALFQRGEKELFAADSQSRLDASLVTFQEAKELFRRLRQQSIAAGTLRETLMDALRLAIATADVVAEPSTESPSIKQWDELTATLLRLRAAMGPTGGTDATALRGIGDDLTTRFAALKEPFRPEVIDAAIKAQDAWTTDELQRMSDRLQSSLLTSADRKRLWETVRLRTALRHIETRRQLDWKDHKDQVRSQPESAVPVDPDATERRRRFVAERLLQLAGETLPNPMTAEELQKRWQEHAAQLQSGGGADLARNAVWPSSLLVQRIPTSPTTTGGSPIPPTNGVRSWCAEHYRKYGLLRQDVPRAAEEYKKAAERVAGP
ncbi:MAG: hypothetical protein ACRCZF_23830 [Gemmataceae bacterium]